MAAFLYEFLIKRFKPFYYASCTRLPQICSGVSAQNYIPFSDRKVIFMWDIQEAIAYYKKQGAPGDQTALTALLREVQQEQGGSIPGRFLPVIGEALGVKESFLLAVIRRIPSLRLEQIPVLELCAGPNCGKHAALSAAAEALLAANPGKFTLKYGSCMRLCGKGPNLKWNGTLYHRADEALLKKLLEGALKT